MSINVSTKKRLFYSAIFCLMSVFMVSAYIIVSNCSKHDLVQFESHAAVIADDMWALNSPGINTYLNLALQTNNYRILKVVGNKGNLFVGAQSTPLYGLEKILFQLKCITVKKYSTDIIYDSKKIGTLEGEQYIRIIYPLLNFFVFLSLVALGFCSIIYLSLNKSLLEQQVLERTRKHRESEQRFHDMVNLLPVMVLETDDSGRLTFGNAMAEQRFGIKELTAAGQSCFDLIVPEQRDRAKQGFFSIADEYDQGMSEYTALGKENVPFPVLVRSAPIFKDREVVGTRGIIVDISERHNLEEDLRRAQKMQAIGLMAGGVAHDLNNILSGMINYPELILMKCSGDPELQTYVEAIKESGMRASEVVADLLTVARGVAAVRSIVNPNFMVDEYLQSPEFLKLKSRYPGFSCVTDLDPLVDSISCSSIHLKKCLMNLVTNAAEAMHGSGQVTISTTNLYQDTPGVKKGNATVSKCSVITVADTGPGIAPQDLKHIFEPFYTKKKMGMSGTGLGLAVVWNTMGDHGGEVRVSSDEQGTAFTLLFPSAGKGIEPTVVKETWQAYKGNGERLLVIDDERQQREIASKLLTILGYQVYAVSSGEEAVDFVSGEAVDLLLLDMQMEPGMNGRQTYEKILEMYPGQKAIVASGFSGSSNVEATLELGAGAFLNKPYTLRKLAEAVYDELNVTVPPAKQRCFPCGSNNIFVQ